MRQEALALRASILGVTCLNYASKPEALPAVVAQYLDEHELGMLAAYLPFRGELDPLPAIAAWLEKNSDTELKFCLPRVEGDELHFYEVAAEFFTRPVCRDDYCESGYAGILEPRQHLTRIAPLKIDCFFIPGVAFDSLGHRMGYGKGYYDRALSQADPQARKVGISYEELIVDELIAEPHDIKMDTILSPSGRRDF